MSTQLIDPATVVAELGIATLEASVRDAVAAVPDPEYPDVSIIDLGLLESLSVGIDESDADVAVAVPSSNHTSTHIVSMLLGDGKNVKPNRQTPINQKQEN